MRHKQLGRMAGKDRDIAPLAHRSAWLASADQPTPEQPVGGPRAFEPSGYPLILTLNIAEFACDKAGLRTVDHEKPVELREERFKAAPLLRIDQQKSLMRFRVSEFVGARGLRE